MICYKDRSFCIHSRECGNDECDRNLTDKDIKEATIWWGDSNFPLQIADLQTKDCGAKLKEGKYGFYRN